jgi:hypothetical protein
MFTRVLGIVLGAFLAYCVTKAMNPGFDLATYVAQLQH